MRKRTQSRECVLKILYQAELMRREIRHAAENFWGEYERIDENIKVFADRLTGGIESNLDTIDEKISQYATNWQLKRMAVIDRNVLRIGVFELLYTADIPPKVTINEAVEIARRINTSLRRIGSQHEAFFQHVSLSFGVAELRSEMDSRTLFRHADDAMYMAKKGRRVKPDAGIDKIYVYGSDDAS